MAKSAPDVAVLGAGGHARVIISTLRAANYNPCIVFDDTEDLWGQKSFGVVIDGQISRINDFDQLVVIAIGDNAARQRIASQFECDWLTLIHPFTWVDPTSSVGSGTVVFAGAVIQAAAKVGSHAIVNTRASVGHDCEIGDFTHVASAVHMGGYAKLGTGSVMAVGSTARNGVSIGDWTVVGVGAAVVSDLPDHVVAVGVPARIKQRL